MRERKSPCFKVVLTLLIAMMLVVAAGLPVFGSGQTAEDSVEIVFRVLGVYTLDLETQGEGVIRLNNVIIEVPFTETYVEGTEITLTAEANEDYSFLRWEGDVPEGSEEDFEIMVIMDGDKTILAVFEEPGQACFIATAAYGSGLDPTVLVLRQFRDTFLLSNKAGSYLAGLYYHYSPALARYIADSEILKGITRFVLIPFIAVAFVALNYTFFLPAALLLCLFMFILRKKRLDKSLLN